MSFEDLNVYQEAFVLQQKIFRMSRSFPREERFSLTDQIRRSSRSIGSNIAEAWQKRRYQAHFVSKLSDADGEQAETRHWLNTALACELIDSDIHAERIEITRSVGRMLGSMMSSPEKFCRAFNE
ncbi:MAG: four helix bundle protein [Verrucomicrobia bacterium]|nr:four helix bundle protein [Verrucomicrobiota bacterium]